MRVGSVSPATTTAAHTQKATDRTPCNLIKRAARAKDNAHKWLAPVAGPRGWCPCRP
uniref:Uncharacterized protein n=1 Tax=Podoviridae sp. ctlpi2 TaxID=2826574 RepID=A0A8S5MLR5_9CAUD|nr:MAG TPA: hypothetical protein [Podoviridae sp. ctlpi2]